MGLSMLKSLQAGRGIAALMVVFYHLNGSIFGKPEYDPNQMHPLFEAGWAGVDFFFVLSGFIIYHVHQKDIGKRGRLGDYAFKRFVRIYPTYWLVLAAIVPIYFLKPSFGAGFETNPAQIAASFALWPMPNYPILQVAWTLRHEVLFYLAFALLIAHRPTGILVLMAWALACGGWLASGAKDFPASFLLHEVNLLFFLGIATAWACDAARLRPTPAACLLIAGVLVFLRSTLAVVEGAPGALTHIGFGIGSALAIFGGVNLERGGRLPVPRLLSLLGDASYSIYLTHFLALSLSAKVLYGSHLDGLLPRTVIFIILLVGATVAGLAFHFYVEKPVLNLFKRRHKGDRSNEVPATS